MAGQDLNPQSQQAIGRRSAPYKARTFSPFADPYVDKTTKTQLVRTHCLHVERQTVGKPPPTARPDAVGRKNTDRIRLIGGTGARGKTTSQLGLLSRKHTSTSRKPPAPSPVTVARAQKLR